jgi:glycosyltransferase involved in cell wall biosynthesis
MVTALNETGNRDRVAAAAPRPGPVHSMDLRETDRESPLLRKRVAMVSFSPYPGDPRVRRAAETLMAEGASVDLICVREEDAPKREVINGVKVVRLPISNSRRGKLAYAYQYCTFILMSAAILAGQSLASRYDVVYVHNMPDVLVLSALLPKMLGAKVVLDLHDPMPELLMTIFGLDRKSFSVRLMSRLERWSMARVHSVITVNVACERLFASRSCPAAKIRVVMNSPDGEIFRFRRPRLTCTQLPHRPFVIMYHGSLVARNGLDLAVDALTRVRKTVPAVELRVYGHSTPFLEHVMESARNTPPSRTIRYLGPKRLEDLVTEIEACDVGVIPNHRSAFTDINTPTRIFEYLALGRPVIAPRTPGIQDYFNPESLFFFDPGNSEELATRIEDVFSDPRGALETVHRGQEVYLTHTWSHEREVLLDVVRGLLQRAEPN